MKGFTLIEILVVLSMVTIIAVVTIPISLNFLKTQNLATTTGVILSTLRQAQTQALFQKNNSSFGVKFLENSYVLFQGSSYNTREVSEDLLLSFPSSITVSGIDEIVFTKQTGLPNTVGAILIMTETASRSIYINQQGTIEL